ncbi:MAG: helix-hairpin-helix domain-containing protein [Mangrovibacterium sp.]
MRLKSFIRDYFSFTRGERIGIGLLLGLMLILLVAGRMVCYFEQTNVPGEEDFSRVLKEFREEVERSSGGMSLFPFDPNTAGRDLLDSLALPSAIRQNMLKYRRAGGIFRFRQDIRKLYGMNDSLYEVIEPYLLLPVSDVASGPEVPASGRKSPVSGTVPDSRKYGKNIRQADPERTEINRASAADLLPLPGIGPVLSERIVKFRDWLGGFHSLAQLREVYGLREETLENILPLLELDSSCLVKLNINTAGFVVLAGHPYLEKTDAQRILRYRKQYGRIGDLRQLLNDSVLEREVYNRILPYLKTGN